MASSNIQPNASSLNIDPVLLARAIEYSKSKKRDLNKVINTFLLKLLSGDIDDFDTPLDFVEKTSRKKPIADILGIFEGKMHMADDFDAPLDCMKDYM